jgi:8-oxo-dGTP pyrophosphatase MutT (NUDIX family)
MEKPRVVKTIEEWYDSLPMKLQDMQTKRCATACGWLLQDGKVLLIKHKMLGIWLSPGGHIDPNELPHQAAEREFFEETGIRVRTVSAQEHTPSVDDSEMLPLPFWSNLHWINRPGENKKRTNGEICSQHYGYSFFVVLDGPISKLSSEDEGVDDVRWFTESELKKIQTNETIYKEAAHVFAHHPNRR